MSRTLASPVSSVLEIKKSRFLCQVVPVADRAQAQALIRAEREAHPDANHVCWALLAGGESGMSDDGEPGGVAGRPMMQVLQHKDLEGVLAMVVRYTDAVAKALLQAQYVERVATLQLAVTLPYAQESRVRQWLQTSPCRLLESRHQERVWLLLEMPKTEVDAVRAALIDLTCGGAQVSA
jgi:putative IMPACT (imprinted ancient) family translation regulator